MGNTITAKVGVDTAPLKKGVAEGEAIVKASAKRVLEEQKKAAKAAEDAFKSALATRVAAEKAAADKIVSETKRRQSALTQGVNSVVSSLNSASSAGDILSSTIAGIGAAGGPLAAVAAGAGLVATGIYNAREEARQLIKELGTLRNSSFTSTGGNSGRDDLLGKAGGISQRLAEIDQAKAEAMIKLGGARGPAGTVSNGLFGSAWEKMSDSLKTPEGMAIASMAPFGIGTAAGAYASTQQGQASEPAKLAAEQKKMIEERTRLLNEALEPQKEELTIAELRARVGERDAALAESRLQTAREIANVEKAMGNASQASKDSVTAPIKARGALEQGDINRRADKAKLELDQRTGNAKDAAAAGIAGMISPRKGAEANIANARKQAAQKRDYVDKHSTGANALPQEERDQMLAEADLLDVQANSQQAALAVHTAMQTPAEKAAERAMTRKNTRSVRAADARAKDRAGREARKGGKGGGLQSGGLTTGGLTTGNLNSPTGGGAHVNAKTHYYNVPPQRTGGNGGGGGGSVNGVASDLAKAIISAVENAQITITNTK